jgi:hypothetical protein
MEFVMKAQKNYFKISSVWIIVLITMALLSGCGKPANKINSSNLSGSGLFYTGNSAFNANPAIVNHVLNIKNGVACQTPNTRLANDTTFFVSGNFPNGTTIQGNFQQGILPGDNSELHVGVSAWGDLMFVTKVTNGSQVLGFNVTLSFCTIPNYYPNYPLLVSNTTQLVNFMAPQGIVLDMNTYCGYGVIDAAFNTAITAQPTTANAYSAPFTFPTSFTKPMCNGQF